MKDTAAQILEHMCSFTNRRMYCSPLNRHGISAVWPSASARNLKSSRDLKRYTHTHQRDPPTLTHSHQHAKDSINSMVPDARAHTQTHALSHTHIHGILRNRIPSTQENTFYTREHLLHKRTPSILSLNHVGVLRSAVLGVDVSGARSTCIWPCARCVRTKIHT